MPHSSFNFLDPYIAAALHRLLSALNALRSAIQPGAGGFKLGGFGWLWLVPALLLLRFLMRRPALFAVVILIAIEAGAATTVARSYTMQVERFFGKLGPMGR